MTTVPEGPSGSQRWRPRTLRDWCCLAWAGVFLATVVLALLGDAFSIPARESYLIVRPIWRVLMFPSREILALLRPVVQHSIAPESIWRVAQSGGGAIFVAMSFTVGFAFWVGAFPWIISQLLRSRRMRGGANAA
jgi:hypothetical protein